MSPSVAASPLRRALLAGAAAAALGSGALATADAEAAFTLARCGGASNVGGIGASFQTSLHSELGRVFQSSIFCSGVGTSPTAPTWRPDGSGAGKAALGANDRGIRDPGYSFGGADEPPTAAELSQMNAGPSGAAGDDGQLRVIPIATGATAFIVHAPEGCSIAGVTNKTDGRSGAFGDVDTTDGAANHTQRIRLTGTQVEAAFAGTVTKWSEIAPGISGTASGIADGDMTNAGRPCGDVPIRRIVRQDRSGTTYSWKAYLDLVNRGRGWNTTYGADNRQWPKAGSGVATVDAAARGSECDGADRLCSPTGSGGGNLAKLVTSTDGSIGYVDLATARSNNFHISPGTSDTDKDETYWSPLQVLEGPGKDTYAEPTYHATAHFPGAAEAAKGANCDTAAITNAATPANSPNGDPTLGDWSSAAAAGGNGYPACALTYAMAWDDSAPVYGASDVEQAKARTVKDYLELLVSSTGQFRLLRADYSPVPAAHLAAAQNGVNAIDWNKRAGGGGPIEPPRVEPPRVVPPRVEPPSSPPAAPSNAFSIPSRKTSASLLTFTVELPGAGVLSVDATTRVGKRTVKVGSAKASASGSGKVTVRLKLSSAAKKALKRAKGKKLKVSVKFTYTPTGGTARTVTQTVTVRAASRRAAGRGGRRGARGKKKSAKR